MEVLCVGVHVCTMWIYMLYLLESICSFLNMPSKSLSLDSLSCLHLPGALPPEVQAALCIPHGPQVCSSLFPPLFSALLCSNDAGMLAGAQAWKQHLFHHSEKRFNMRILTDISTVEVEAPRLTPGWYQHLRVGGMNGNCPRARTTW